MSFIHDDPQFSDLLRVVADARGLELALVEKDYWVTHALWALLEQGFDVWFKGGTSLSKGFGLIERFSEDLDLKIEPGRVNEMPRVRSWKSESAKATAERRTSLEWLAGNLRVPGTTVQLDTQGSESRAWRAADVQVLYPGLHAAALPGGMKPYVVLEVGSARVVPFLPCDLSSFVHDHLAATGLLSEYVDTRPRSVRCVHPLVTLLEKLDAVGRRAPRAEVEAATYVRHYEDAARIIGHLYALPPLPDYPHARALADEMCAQHQLRAIPVPEDPVFDLRHLPHGDRIRDAYVALDPMYWGPRLTLDAACEAVRTWIRDHLG